MDNKNKSNYKGSGSSWPKKRIRSIASPQEAKETEEEWRG